MDKINGAVRLAAAYLVGWALALILQWTGIVIDDETRAALVQAVSLVLSLLYYVTVRFLAGYFPWVEWFLIIPKSPVYVEPAKRAHAIKQMKALKLQ